MSVGLPLNLELEIRLVLDETSALVREIAICALALNGRPLVPTLISDALRRAAGPDAGAAGAVAGRAGGAGGLDIEDLLSGLMPWLRGPA